MPKKKKALSAHVVAREHRVRPLELQVLVEGFHRSAESVSMTPKEVVGVHAVSEQKESHDLLGD